MLTASIVLYNTEPRQIETILKSIYESQIINKLYIIDNAPTEQNKKYFETCKLKSIIEYIEHDNTGYGSSHNIALRKAIENKSDYHIVLNPDICFEGNVLSELLEFMNSNKDVVYVLPKVTYPNGELQYLCKHLPYVWDLFSRRFGTKLKIMQRIDYNYSLHFFSYNKIINPPCLSGCFMFLRVSILEENNLFFDDRFFMYFEDFDLIRRLHKYGKTIFYPNVSIIHAHAAQAHTSKKMFWIFIKSMCIYFNKWGWFFDKERKLWNRLVDEEINKVDVL